MAGERVLVIDDGKENRDFVTEYVLRPAGYVALQAKDGVEGLEAAQTQRPDLILLDLQMPRLNGVQVLQAMRQQALNIPVILMTFHGSEEIAIDVFRLGVHDYVKKPYTIDEMLRAIESCFAETRIRRDSEALTTRLLNANRELHTRLKESTKSGTGTLRIPAVWRDVTILHAGLRGAIPAPGSDPAAFMEALNRSTAQALETIIERGGTILSFTGEAIWAVFNAPDDQPDHIARAVDSARLIHSAGSSGTVKSTLAIGLASGAGLCSRLGAGQISVYTVLGEAVAEARRLQEAAAIGTVLFSERFAAALDPKLRTARVGEVQVRGRAEAFGVFTFP